MATQPASQHTLYQVSTAIALVEGIYQGAVRVGTLRENRDIGLGTFENHGAYDMVRFQEVAKYGRASGVDFGPVDVVRFAEAFGAKGLKIEQPGDIAPILKRALEMQGPVLVGVPVDYRDNHRLMEIVHSGVLN